MNCSQLQQTAIFQGCSETEIETMLPCLQAMVRSYGKGMFVHQAGDYVETLGILLSGEVQIERTDFWGNQRIFDRLTTFQVFAETYACIPQEPLSVDVVATAESEILFLKAGKVLQLCEQSCPFHQRLLQNLSYVLAHKNLMLTRKINHLTQRSIREKLRSYLSSESDHQHSKEFIIPFNRQELADYLSVDRSALSLELSKMQREGLLTYRKNQFTLLRD